MPSVSFYQIFLNCPCVGQSKKARNKTKRYPQRWTSAFVHGLAKSNDSGQSHNSSRRTLLKCTKPRSVSDGNNCQTHHQGHTQRCISKRKTGATVQGTVLKLCMLESLHHIYWAVRLMHTFPLFLLSCSRAIIFAGNLSQGNRQVGSI